MKNVAILGSSGGNLFNLGGAYPERLLQEIYTQLHSAGLGVSAVQFIAAEESMDVAKPTTAAAVYSLTAEEKDKPQISFQGKLSEVNDAVKSSDVAIAAQIRAGAIDGIIIMSADPDRSNKEAILAAIEKKIPIVGTGGTSMAIITSKGANVIATSGTTGTNSRTRAISFTASLCKYWQIKYTPVLGSGDATMPGSDKSLLKRINIRSIMIPALPGFIAMAIVLALSHIPGLQSLNAIFELLLKGLPVIVAVIAAKQVSELDEVSIVAGVVAGVLSVEGGLIGGILGGIGVGIMVRYLFGLCLKWQFPMTTINIVAGGLSGLFSGLVMYYLLSPLALAAGDYIKLAIEATLAFSPILAGLLAGLVIWPAILGGVYHAVILPLVLLEMEKSGVSFLGAVDMVGLVMVAAGINLANVIAPREKSEAAVAAPGLLINLGFGTFVESAYPFMFSNKAVFAGAIFSAGVGGMLLGLLNIKGVAYVPAFASPFLSNNAFSMAIVMAVTLVLTCVITLLANKFVAIKKAVPESPTPGISAKS
ncbi:putative phosphotransferase system protein [Yersinia enterocolitica]|uniref:PTS sugar transporter n=1 Tax=Yersinia enterocolitica TaxID=630 RepID=UPI0005E359BB|nr:PTS sugar transporter [Yersinia enterocolitica]CQD63823.1 putative phosphotransferase system protein [Yersinia enterocolitica]